MQRTTVHGPLGADPMDCVRIVEVLKSCSDM